MQRIRREPYRFYGFYSKSGGHELRNFEAGETVSEATIKRFAISKEFLETQKNKGGKNNGKRKD